jgi:hypothetical protein
MRRPESVRLTSESRFDLDGDLTIAAAICNLQSAICNLQSRICNLNLVLL